MPKHAIDHLRRCDDRLGEWIDRIGRLQLPVPEAREPYVALLETIAHQQLAGAAARSIWARVIGLSKRECHARGAWWICPRNTCVVPAYLAVRPWRCEISAQR
jgi:3-methyladenine DNA glycosylase/8-oxoguanine DNA glycosylase